MAAATSEALAFTEIPCRVFCFFKETSAAMQEEKITFRNFTGTKAAKEIAF